jgi:hypothetical protein
MPRRSQRRHFRQHPPFSRVVAENTVTALAAVSAGRRGLIQGRCNRLRTACIGGNRLAVAFDALKAALARLEAVSNSVAGPKPPPHPTRAPTVVAEPKAAPAAKRKRTRR